MLRDAWRSRIGRVHGLEFQEAVGRGGFETLFKSTWRGIQIAVKLVEHSVDSRITKQLQREAALATSCSHSNIVVTYKVATAGLGDLQKLPHYVEVSAAASGTEVELTPLAGRGGSGSRASGGGGSTSKSASTVTTINHLRRMNALSITEYDREEEIFRHHEEPEDETSGEQEDPEDEEAEEDF